MFARSKYNPILKPSGHSSWEDKKVYNPAVLIENGKYHLFYRAYGKNGRSSIGYAHSDDGEKFYKAAQPVLKPVYTYEKFGNEDPRITKISKGYYLTFTVYDGQSARLAFATSRDLKNWKKRGLMIKDWNLKKAGGFIIPWDSAQQNPVAAEEWIKAGGIFSSKMQNKFWMIFGDRNLWLAYSKNSLNWKAVFKPFIKPRPRYFDSAHVEMGPAPIKTEFGWLVLYHGIDKAMTYRLGFILLDLKDPKKILYRSPKPIFEPKAKYELSSKIDITNDKRPRVIFCCGAVLVGDILRIYYGAGDKYVCTATAKLDDIFALLPKNLKNTGQ